MTTVLTPPPRDLLYCRSGGPIKTHNQRGKTPPGKADILWKIILA